MRQKDHSVPLTSALPQRRHPSDQALHVPLLVLPVLLLLWPLYRLDHGPLYEPVPASTRYQSAHTVALELCEVNMQPIELCIS